MGKRFTRKENEVFALSPSATQVDQGLYATPSDKRETFVGMKGNLLITPGGTAGGTIGVTIYHRREDSNIPTLSVTDGTEISTHLRDVLYSHIQAVDPDIDIPINIPLNIKTARKMKEGDEIFISALASGSGIADVDGVANIFLKEV